MSFAPPRDEKAEWLRCRPWIEAALEHAHGTHTIEDIEVGIESGQYYFFCSANAAVVTEIITFPRMKALNYFLIGGDLDDLKTTIEPFVTAWAKHIGGCSRVIGIGRKGFERAFMPNGFKSGWTAIYKDIT